MRVYLKPAFEKALKAAPAPKLPASAEPGEISGIDRTAKMYVGGKQARGDSGYARMVVSPEWQGTWRSG